MLTDTEIIIRLLVAAGLGAIIGFERERSHQAAGLRTHIVLAVGAALAMMLSINLALEYHPIIGDGDTARLAAQVVSGIGFLGAGAILRYGTSIKGLTTAATLWTLAMVGMVVGAGYYLAATSATAILVVVLFILNILENRVINPYTQMNFVFSAEDRPGLVPDLKKLLEQNQVKYSDFSVQRNLTKKIIKVQAILQVKNEVGVEGLMDDLSHLPGARAFKVG